MPKQLLYEEISLDKRNQGRHQKRFKDCVKVHIAHAAIPKAAGALWAGPLWLECSNKTGA